MTDLIERLRARASYLDNGEQSYHQVDRAMHTEAADEIERLRAALEKIVNFDHDQDCLPGCDSIAHEELCPYCNPEMVLIEIAREALKGQD